MKRDDPYLQTILVAVLYVVVYWATFKLLTEPWRAEMYLRKIREITSNPRERLTAAQEIAIRQFRTEISKWDHEQTARDN